MKNILLTILSFILLISCDEKQIQPDIVITLEMDTPSLLKELAGRKVRKETFINTFNKTTEDFKKDSIDFIETFAKNFNLLYPDRNLKEIFNTNRLDADRMGNNLTNEETLYLLKEYESKAADKTYIILENRINNILDCRLEGTIKNNIITLNIEGDININKLNKIIETEGKLEFWHTYKNTQIGNQIFESANKILSDKMYPGFKDSIENINTKKYFDSTTEITDDINWDEYYGENENSLEVAKKLAPLSAILFPYVNEEGLWMEGSVLGYAKLSDTNEVNKLLNKDYVKAILPARDLAFIWEAKSMANIVDGEPLLMLYLIKKNLNGEPLIDGDKVLKAEQEFNQITNFPMISLEFKSAGASAWEEMTEQSAKEQTGIAICIDNKVFSAPVASMKIEGGRTQITGGSFAGENGVKEAKLLTDIINAGAMPVPITIKSINQIKSEPK